MGTMSHHDLDRLILAAARTQWSKMAMIIGRVWLECGRDAVSEDAIASRIRNLVENGKLQAQGNLARWRHSEVKLPD